MGGGHATWPAFCERPFRHPLRRPLPDVFFAAAVRRQARADECPRRLVHRHRREPRFAVLEKIAELWPEQACEKNGICAPGARVLDGRVHLFYQTYGNQAQDAICHAVSDDGVHFTRAASNPVFHPTGDWTAGRAIDAEVFPVGDRLLLYFATRDPLMKTQFIGVAGADLKSDFSRATWRQLCDAPILQPELPWEKQCLEAPTVCRHGDRLFMFYAGGYNNEPQQIGVAASTDGLHWQRVFDRPFLANGRPGEWNASESGHPGVLTDGDQTWLFFQGNSDRGHTWFLSCLPVDWADGKPSLAPPRRQVIF